MPDQAGVLRGLEREDLFTVVFDQVMTDTAAYADLVCPTRRSSKDMRFGAAMARTRFGGIQPVIARRGEARPNEEVFALLGRAMGFRDEPFTWDTRTSLRKIAAAIEMPGRCGSDPEAMEAGRRHSLSLPGPRRCSLTVFPQTATGKFILSRSALGLLRSNTRK